MCHSTLGPRVIRRGGGRHLAGTDHATDSLERPVVLRSDPGTSSHFRAGRELLEGLVSENQGQNLAMTVLYVPYPLTASWLG